MSDWDLERFRSNNSTCRKNGKWRWIFTWVIVNANFGATTTSIEQDVGIWEWVWKWPRNWHAAFITWCSSLDQPEMRQRCRKWPTRWYQEVKSLTVHLLFEDISWLIMAGDILRFVHEKCRENALSYQVVLAEPRSGWHTFHGAWRYLVIGCEMRLVRVGLDGWHLHDLNV